MSKGFTLIELLVVITIIGILAGVVLVYFPTATKVAKDSRIVSAIGQARTIMAYLYAIDGNYANFSCSSTDMAPLCAEISNNGGVAYIQKTSNNAAACIYSQLTAKLNYWYCADSTGKAGYTTTSPATTNYCTGGTTAVCPPVY
jgi:prepilin-type N-terminal cleavage/methylation domain-containing protein